MAAEQASVTTGPSRPATGTARVLVGARHRGLALAVICFAQLIMVLDTTIVTVALPAIQRGLNFSAANLVWVTTAYTLTFGGLLILGGRAGDLFGRQRMCTVGLAVFVAAGSFGWLATISPTTGYPPVLGALLLLGAGLGTAMVPLTLGAVAGCGHPSLAWLRRCALPACNSAEPSGWRCSPPSPSPPPNSGWATWPPACTAR